ncbi:MAG: tyrosine-protein phosphatase [Rhodococcus sp.]|nr:tyrosine-protein phosphatase [Rhodococcus sp. (in: high G+C Gram-positive bacteria)]
MTATIDIQLSAPVNLRDLGGIRVGDSALRDGFVVRADDLSMITSEVAQDLVENGLTGVIDLRSKDEVALTGRGPLAAHRVTYHHLPLMDSMTTVMDNVTTGTGSAKAFSVDRVHFGEMYASMVEVAADRLVSALSIMAVAPGTTAFHCAGGRDRTGVLAATLLLALGADDDAIVTDYAATEANMPAINARLRPVVSVLMSAKGVDADEMASQMAALTEPSSVSMLTMLARLRDRHGDPLAPLRAAGLSNSVVAQLKARALAG